MYSAIFNPHPEEYKLVSLHRNSSLPARLSHNHYFYVHPGDDSKVIAPPRIVDEAVRMWNQFGDYEISSITTPDPSNFPEHISIRIRGEVPDVVTYADKLTYFDPRVHQAANTILLSEDYPHQDQMHEEVNKQSPFLPGDPAPLELVEEMGRETELIDPAQNGTKFFPGYKKLLSLGHKFEEKYPAVEVKYGGHFYTPSESRPHGSFGLSTIYIYMTEFNPAVKEEAIAEFKSPENENHSADEFDIIKESDERYPPDYNVIRAWWD